MVLYASLSMSLLTASGAVLGTQYCKSNKYSRGSQEEQGKRRQEKFDGLIAWYFDGVVQSFPVLLQISLLLFRTALGAKMWCEQPSIAWVIISTTDFGLQFPQLPYQGLIGSLMMAAWFCSVLTVDDTNGKHAVRVPDD
ncbi:hypothetical protein BDR06DRAFT_418051 [Suillus hirtellus]|nr:hypothetical protein BDR06DRAFT_418051 [Suillus hirtellus]